jgi:hypothetical protein
MAHPEAEQVAGLALLREDRQRGVVEGEEVVKTFASRHLDSWARRGGPIMRYAIVALVLSLAGPAYAQVQVDIGIHLPAPPHVVVVPGVPTVQYAPALPANIFVYGGQYWVFANGGWYVSRGYNGPWIVVGPQFVPRPILRVPVRYYRVPPGHWKQGQHQASPPWDREWGHEWADKRGWKGHGDDRRDSPEDGRGKGHGRGR